MIENIDNFCIGFIFSIWMLNYLFYIPQYYHFVVVALKFYSFTCIKSGFLSRLLIKVKKTKAFLESLAK